MFDVILTPGNHVAYTAAIDQLRPHDPSNTEIDRAGLSDVDVQVAEATGGIYLEIVRVVGDQVFLQERGTFNGSPVERPEFAVPLGVAAYAVIEATLESLRESAPGEDEENPDA